MNPMDRDDGQGGIVLAFPEPGPQVAMVGLGAVADPFAKLRDVWDTALRLWAGCGLTDAALSRVGGMLSTRAAEIAKDMQVPITQLKAFQVSLRKPATAPSCEPAARFSASDTEAVIKRLTDDAGWNPNRYGQGDSFFSNLRQAAAESSLAKAVEAFNKPLIPSLPVKPWHVALALGAWYLWRKR